MLLDVRVQQIVQLRGKLDASWTTTDDAEVQLVAPLDVRHRWLVRQLEACSMDTISDAHHRRSRKTVTFKDTGANRARVGDILQKVCVFFDSGNIEGWRQ